MHTRTHSTVVLLATPGGLGGCVLCKTLRRGEVGVSHTPFMLRLIAPGLCYELGLTDKRCECVCVRLRRKSMCFRA